VEEFCMSILLVRYFSRLESGSGIFLTVADAHGLLDSFSPSLHCFDVDSWLGRHRRQRFRLLLLVRLGDYPAGRLWCR